jgi:predicted site-specific integrase-resolvase
MLQPVDPVTLEEAGRILGCTPTTVERHIRAGRLTRHGERYQRRALSRAEVEALAVELYRWTRNEPPNPWSYFVTGKRAADVLGVSRARLGQLAHADRIPYVQHPSGRRLYRQAQLEVMSHGQ